MGVYALKGRTTCTDTTLTELQNVLKETANAFCFLYKFTAVNLPDSFDVNSLGDVSLTKLDISENKVEQERGAAIALFVLAALSLATAIAIFAKSLGRWPGALSCLQYS